MLIKSIQFTFPTFMISKPKFLVADNDPKGVLSMHEQLQLEFSCTFTYTHHIEKLDEIISPDHFDILFYDLNFSAETDCIDELKKLHQLSPKTTIIPLVPITMLDRVKDLLALQLFFYITKPIDTAEITITIRRALETISLRYIDEIPTETSKIESSHHSFQGMIGSSPSMKQLFDIINRVAEDDYSTVLIRGESGTGKEMVAKAIHQQSKRSANNFVPVNCAAIPDELLESELFGYTKGAFTGATSNKMGRIQYADLGTLFLDEIGDMKPSLQAKLLRVLQEKEFEPVGGFKTIAVDTRVLAATHCNLEKLVEQGLFREDLYYRLSVIPLNIPPLRERKEDIALLISLFIDQYTTARGRVPFTFSAEAKDALMQHNWRGNVRELENLVQHMSVLYSGSTINHHELPHKFQSQKPATPETTPNERSALWSTPVSETFLSSENNDFLSEREALFSTPLPPMPAEPSFQEQDAPIVDAPNTINEKQNDLSPEHPEVCWVKGYINFKEVIDGFENKLIIQALRITKGNKKEAASILTLKRTTLLEKIKKKGLHNSWQESGD